MRLFTALDLPVDVRRQCAALQAPDALAARWSSPSQFHITVRFLGEHGPDEAARYEEALSAVDAPVAECVPYGLDVLPSRRNPSVLILGLKRTDSLLSVYQLVSAALEGAGLDPESRSYRPHVTLARLDDVPREAVHSFLDTQEAAVDAFRADAVHLYESTLTPDGAVHDRRASVALGS